MECWNSWNTQARKSATPLKKTIVTFDYFYVRNWTMLHQKKKKMSGFAWVSQFVQ
jgi:hypothetical protein